MCLVVQPCQTLCNPMACSLPGCFVHGDTPGKNTGVGCYTLLQGIFPTQGLNPHLPHCRQMPYSLESTGKPIPSPGDLPYPGIKSESPELQADSLPAELQGKPHGYVQSRGFSGGTSGKEPNCQCRRLKIHGSSL